MKNTIFIDLSEAAKKEAKEKKTLNKPFRLPKGSSKKFGVYVKNPKTEKTIMVKFGDPNMEIRRDDPEARKNFRARHKCDTKKDKTTPGYWSCKMWSDKPVSEITASFEEIIKIDSSLKNVEVVEDVCEAEEISFASVQSTLNEKAKEHNKTVDSDSKKTTGAKLMLVYKRGIGAWKTNPESVRTQNGKKMSKEQWAMARVNSFLYVLKNGKFRSGKHDTDLLPKGHPMENSEEKK